MLRDALLGLTERGSLTRKRPFPMKEETLMQDAALPFRPRVASPADRALQGIMSLQLEGSGQIWYRNVYAKALE